MSYGDIIGEPTGEQCSNNNMVFSNEHKKGIAVWYPQMGGYSAKAVVLMDHVWTEFVDSEGDVRGAEGGCLDLLIWHDGDFPFCNEDGRSPVHLHHCGAESFVEFGELITGLNDEGCEQESYPGG